LSWNLLRLLFGFALRQSVYHSAQVAANSHAKTLCLFLLYPRVALCLPVATNISAHWAVFFEHEKTFKAIKMHYSTNVYEEHERPFKNLRFKNKDFITYKRNHLRRKQPTREEAIKKFRKMKLYPNGFGCVSNESRSF
jgi:hypothetical protein